MSEVFSSNCKKPELLSPAGDADKLRVVYEYGADAAYMGVFPFSLRKKAHEASVDDSQIINNIKNEYPDKKLYGAMNMVYSPSDIALLKDAIPFIKSLNLDGIIVSDMGAFSILRSAFPDMSFHLSTQSSCINEESAKFYKKAGFKRVILGRECSMDDIKVIKDTNPDLEIEVFVHGAMCMAVSGRCILSKALSDRSANKGLCSHSCRWSYRLALEEKERPGVYMPIAEDAGFTTILSSRDLCMIDHLDELAKAGVDSFKIEGRMKSIYYAAIVTRAYRKAMDGDKFSLEYIRELENVSHREYTSGFFYGKEKYDFAPPAEEYTRNYRFLGIVGEEVKPGVFALDVRYKIPQGEEIEFIGPEVILQKDNNFKVLDSNFEQVTAANCNGVFYIKPSVNVRKGHIIRSLS